MFIEVIDVAGRKFIVNSGAIQVIVPPTPPDHPSHRVWVGSGIEITIDKETFRQLVVALAALDARDEITGAPVKYNFCQTRGET